MNILHLEDVKQDALIIEHLIEIAFPDCVYRLEDSEAGLRQALVSYKPDIVLSDYNMKQFDGLTALRICSKEAPEIPFIIVTGTMNEDIAVVCIKSGAVDYLIKDNLKRLPSAISNAIEQNRVKLENKHREKELIASEQKYRSIFENILDVYYETTPEGIILEISPSISILSLFTREELIGRSMYDFYANPKQREELLAEIQEKGFVDNYEIKMIDKDSREVYIAINAKFMKGKTDSESKICGIVRDISKQKLMIQELIEAKTKAEEANSLKTYFLANMSHELRTPMSGILGFSEILSELITEPQANGMVKIINTSAQRLHNTLNSILDISRIESSKSEIMQTQFDLEKLIKDIMNSFEMIASDKSLSLSFVSYVTETSVVSDSRLMESVITELINNALKYTDKGSVTIRLQMEKQNQDDNVTIEISDTGIGIPKDKQEFVFDAFRQANEGYGRLYDGNGLGLTIAKKKIELLGGRISLESNEGEGSTFRIHLPVIKAKPEITETPTQQSFIKNAETHKSHHTQGVRILLIDDDEITFLLVKQMLSDVTIDYAQNREEGMEMLSKYQYPIVLLDINLKNSISGLDVLKLIRLKNGYHSTPVVAITAYAMVGDRETLIERGFTHYLSKPFNKEGLQEIVYSILEQ